MQPDLSLVIGLVVGVFAIPAAISAYSEGRPPHAAAFGFLVAGGFVLYAITAKPGGYRPGDIPDAIFRVIAQILG